MLQCVVCEDWHHIGVRRVLSAPPCTACFRPSTVVTTIVLLIASLMQTGMNGHEDITSEPDNDLAEFICTPCTQAHWAVLGCYQHCRVDTRVAVQPGAAQGNAACTRPNMSADEALQRLVVVTRLA